MEAVAARAGTSKPVPYRRWPDRLALLRDVLLRQATDASCVLWHRFLITGDPIDDAVVVQIVDEVLVPFVAPR